MPRISQLPSLSAADNADEIAIVDVSASTTKKITRGDLLKSPLPTNSVTTAAVANASITAAKIANETFSYARMYFSSPTVGQVVASGSVVSLTYTDVDVANSTGITKTGNTLSVETAGLYSVTALLSCIDAPQLSLHSYEKSVDGGTTWTQVLGFTDPKTPADNNKRQLATVSDVVYLPAGARVRHIVNVAAGSSRFGGTATAPHSTSFTLVKMR